MTIVSNKIDQFQVPFLIFFNTYFFWIVILTMRGFALTTSIESAISLILFALIIIVVEFFVQGLLKNLVAAKIGFVFSTMFLIILNLPVLSLEEFEFYYLFILIGYGMFFPGFYTFISEATKDSNNKGSILIVFSFILSFIANLIERYFLLTFNQILNTVLIFVINPILCVLFIISINKLKQIRIREKQQKSSLKAIVKNRLKSIMCSFIIASVFVFQMVLFNNPSLIGISTMFDYDLAMFFIIVSYAIFACIILLFSFQFETKDKKFRLMILIINIIILTTFFLGFLFHSPFQMVLSLVSNVLLLSLLLIIFSYQQSSQIQSSILTIIFVTFILYLLSSAFGIYRFILLIVSLLLFIFSILFLLSNSNRELSISYNIKSRKNIKEA